MAEQATSDRAPVTIKKYANRRLYNTATSSYVTLDHLAQMVKDGVDFVVYDAKTGEDITHQVLTQIIVEEEGKGHNLLPISFLRHLISFYGDSLQALVPRYLDYTMQSFARNQEQMRQYIREAMNGLFPFGQFEEMGKQNMALFESAVRMFSPFYREENGPREPGVAEGNAATKASPSARRADLPAGGEDLRALKARLDEVQKQLDHLIDERRKPE